MSIRILLAATELPPGDILALEPSTLVYMLIQAFNVLLLTAVLVFVLFKPVKRFMAARRERIQAELDAAQQKTEEAQALYDKYSNLLESANSEREEILRAARRNALERSDAMMAQARREVELINLRAMTEIELEKKNTEELMKKAIVELAMVMAGRFVAVSIDEKTQHQLVDQALSDWDGGAYDT